MKITRRAVLLLSLQLGLLLAPSLVSGRRDLTNTRTAREPASRKLQSPEIEAKEHGAATALAEMFADAPNQPHHSETYQIGLGHAPEYNHTGKEDDDATTTTYKHEAKKGTKAAKAAGTVPEHPSEAPTHSIIVTATPTTAPLPPKKGKGIGYIRSTKAPGPIYKKKSANGGEIHHDKLAHDEEYYYEEDMYYYYEVDHYPKYAKSSGKGNGKGKGKGQYPYPSADDDHFDESNSTLAPTESKVGKNTADYYDESYEEDEGNDFTQSTETDVEDPIVISSIPTFRNQDDPPSTSNDSADSANSLEVLIPVASAVGVLVCCLWGFVCLKRRRKEVSPEQFKAYQQKVRRVEDETVDGTADLTDARTFAFSEDGIERHQRLGRSARSDKGSQVEDELREIMEGIEEFEEVSLHEDDEENQRYASKSESPSNQPPKKAFRPFSDILSSAIPPVRQTASRDDSTSTVSDIYVKASNDTFEDDHSTDSKEKANNNSVTLLKTNAETDDKNTESDVIDLTSHGQDETRENGQKEPDGVITKSPSLENNESPKEQAVASGDSSTELKKETVQISSTPSSAAEDDGKPAWMKNLKAKPKVSPPPPPASTGEEKVPEWIRKYNEMKFQKADDE